MDAASAVVGLAANDPSGAGEIKRIELPQVGNAVKVGDGVATVVFANSTRPVCAPLSGSIVKVNRDLESHPELLTQAVRMVQAGSSAWKLRPERRSSISSPRPHIVSNFVLPRPWTSKFRNFSIGILSPSQATGGTRPTGDGGVQRPCTTVAWTNGRYYTGNEAAATGARATGNSRTIPTDNGSFPVHFIWKLVAIIGQAREVAGQDVGCFFDCVNDGLREVSVAKLVADARCYVTPERLPRIFHGRPYRR